MDPTPICQLVPISGPVPPSFDYSTLVLKVKLVNVDHSPYMDRRNFKYMYVKHNLMGFCATSGELLLDDLGKLCLFFIYPELSLRWV